MIVTRLIVQSLFGRSERSVGVAAIASTTSMPSVTLPKIVYEWGRPPSLCMMKNWLPFVLGPALAIATVPRVYEPGPSISSRNL